MTCCTYTCNQGRDCPVRATITSATITPATGSPGEPATVAPVKRRTCDALGVCQSQTAICPCGDTKPAPTGIVFLDEPDYPPYPGSFDQIAYTMAVWITRGLALFTVFGTAGYAYSKYFGA